MTNKSVMTFISVNKISVCLSVWYPTLRELIMDLIPSRLGKIQHFNFVKSFRDRKVACSASDRQFGGQSHLIHLTLLRMFLRSSLAYVCKGVCGREKGDGGDFRFK